MSVSAALVMQLRERTGAGMMECKKFLVAANGDIELAISEMRKAGQAKADKKADRIAAEGRIVAAFTPDKKHGVMLEVNCETDFVGLDGNFIQFANDVAQTALDSDVSDVSELGGKVIASRNQTIEEARQELVAKIGENIKIRRMTRMNSEGVIGLYLHGNRIGVMVSLKQNDVVPLKLLYDTVKMGNLSQYNIGIWCYKSTGFKTAQILINYFDLNCNFW